MVRECREGSGDYAETKWSRSDLPAPVYLAESEARLESDVKKAIEFWSPYVRWAGYVKPLQDPGDPAIIVDTVPEDPQSKTRGHANPKWIGACQIRRVLIGIPMPQMEGSVRECRVAHEIGHALGLDHDDDEDSVMKNVRGTLFRCEITKEDQALLAKTYGK